MLSPWRRIVGGKRTGNVRSAPDDGPTVMAMTDPELIEVKGANGTVRFDGRAVTIIRSGFVARSTVGAGEKRIPLRSITAVQWKAPTFLGRGFIQFTIPGGTEQRSKPGRQTRGAVSDENSVLVSKGMEGDFLRLKAAIEAALDE